MQGAQLAVALALQVHDLLVLVVADDEELVVAAAAFVVVGAGGAVLVQDGVVGVEGEHGAAVARQHVQAGVGRGLVLFAHRGDRSLLGIEAEGDVDAAEVAVFVADEVFHPPAVLLGAQHLVQVGEVGGQALGRGFVEVVDVAFQAGLGAQGQEPHQAGSQDSVGFHMLASLI